MLSRFIVILALIFVAIGNARAEVYPLVITPGDANETIAVGDSVAFSSKVTGTVYTYLNCGAYNAPFHIKPCQQVTLPFKKPGFYSAIVKDGAGLEIASVKISVVKAFMSPRADQVGFTRVADFHVLPNASMVTFRSNNPSLLDVVQTGQTGEVAHLTLLAKARGDLRVQAVIQSPAGPRVIGEARIDEFTIDTPSLYETLIDASSEIGTSRLTMHPFTPNVIVTFTMFAHRSTFAGGVKTFTVSSNLFTKQYNPTTKETDGVFLFDIEMPTDENRYCLSIDFSQANSDPVPIGGSGGVNGSGCKVTVDPIVMAADSAGKDLVATVVEAAPNGGSKHAITIVASAGLPTEAVFDENKKTISTSMIDCAVKGSQVKLRVLPGKTGKYYDVQIEQTIFSKRITVVAGVINIPKRIGLTPGGHDRSVQGTATVTPAGEAANCTITSNAKLQISNMANAGGTITFTVTALGRSFALLDADATVTHSTVGALAVDKSSVVVPFKIATPHPTFNGPVTPTRQLRNATTTPPLAVPAPEAHGVIDCGTTLSIKVLDQFNIACGDVYAGAAVTESDSPINAFLRPDSTYPDQLGVSQDNIAFRNIAGPNAQLWLNGGLPPYVNPRPGDSGPQNVKVEIDGISLFEAIVGRQLILTVVGDVFNLEVRWP